MRTHGQFAPVSGSDSRVGGATMQMGQNCSYASYFSHPVPLCLWPSGTMRRMLVSMSRTHCGCACAAM